MSLYFKQLLGGRDFAVHHPVAGQMANFVYLIGSDSTKECWVVDPAWDPQGIMDYASRDGFKVVGAICTHYHGDHLGGKIFGMEIPGLLEFLELSHGRAYAHEIEIPWIARGTGVHVNQLMPVQDGQSIDLGGGLKLKIHWTPGHTAGGICLEFENKLVTADTLFLSGCGRTDLPGGDSGELYDSLFGKIAQLDPNLQVYCGHAYSGESASLGHVIQNNPIFKITNRSEFVNTMGG